MGGKQPGDGQILIPFIIRTHHLLLALFAGYNVLKVVFLFYTVPLRLDAVCEVFMFPISKREK
jgi:hypothetical protein